MAEYTKADAVEAIRSAAEDLGHTPSSREYVAEGYRPSYHTVQSLFGSWSEGVRAAGLEPRTKGRKVRTEINTSYFDDIDSEEKAYWLGTLYATSGFQDRNGSPALALGRIKERRYFVEEFCEAVDSEYSIYEAQSGGDSDIVQVIISHPSFLASLEEYGFSMTGPPREFPSMTEYRSPFVRGFLEASGYFSSKWEIKFDHRTKAEQFQQWSEEFGVKRPTLSEDANGRTVLHVSNVFDVSTMFEACWPQATDTAPSYEPYVRKVLDHLAEEYPYPENLDYLNGG